MTTAPTRASTSVLPVAVHGASNAQAIESDRELVLPFEEHLKHADALTTACMQARIGASEALPTVGRDPLHGVLDAVLAVSGRDAHALNLASYRSAAVSTVTLLNDLCARETENARQRHLSHAMDPALTKECLRLVTELNTRLSGTDD